MTSSRLLLPSLTIPLPPQAWVKYLREDFSTIALRASTQNSSRLGQAKIDLKAEDAVINTSKCVGADTLLSLLANYCRIKKVETSISVGVVGLTTTIKHLRKNNFVLWATSTDRSSSILHPL